MNKATSQKAWQAIANSNPAIVHDVVITVAGQPWKTRAILQNLSYGAIGLDGQLLGIKTANALIVADDNIDAETLQGAKITVLLSESKAQDMRINVCAPHATGGLWRMALSEESRAM